MPREVSPLYRIYETGDSGAVVYLNADAETFWSVILRHALHNLESLYGASYGYRILDLGYSDPRSTAPALNEMGRYMWLDSPSDSPSGHWHGGRLCWEPVGAGRLRVVYLPVSDLPPNLDMAWKVLDVIRKVYPEAQDQLPDVVGLIDSWAYDEATRDWWRDQVEMRLEREQGRVVTAEVTLGRIVNLSASAHTRSVTPDTVELSVEGITTGAPVIDTVAIGAPRPERPPVYSNTDLRTTLVHYLVTQRGVSSLEAACGLVAVARGTYTSHRDSNPPKFVTPEEYLRRVGKTLGQDADEHLARS